MPIGTDFEIQSDKDIRYIGAAHGASGAGYYSVLEFHRWLQDLADDANSTGDDLLDISKETPSDKLFETIIELLNGFNIDDVAAEHLFGGSIIQSGGAVIYDGLNVIAPVGTHVEIVQNGAIIANDFWNTTPFGASALGLNPDPDNGISHRFLVKVRTASADIDGRRLLVQTREWGKQYSEFKINGTGRGINVAALAAANDLNNQTAIGTVAGWSDVTNLTAGYNTIDVNDDTVVEPYYSRWDRGGRSINQFYERMKWVSRRGSAETLYGLNGELFRGITHEVAVTTPRSGTVAEGVACSWTGGTGQVLARDSGTTATKLWIQLLTGVAPTAGQTITIGAATVTAAAGTPSTERQLSFPFCGDLHGQRPGLGGGLRARGSRRRQRPGRGPVHTQRRAHGRLGHLGRRQRLDPLRHPGSGHDPHPARERGVLEAPVFLLGRLDVHAGWPMRRQRRFRRPTSPTARSSCGGATAEPARPRRSKRSPRSDRPAARSARSGCRMRNPWRSRSTGRLRSSWFPRLT